jgi:hypothetical protein
LKSNGILTDFDIFVNGNQKIESRKQKPAEEAGFSLFQTKKIFDLKERAKL